MANDRGYPAKYKGRGVFRSFFRRFSRQDKRTMNILGRIRVPLPEHADKILRNPDLVALDAYYEGRQYDHLYPWDMTEGMHGGHIPVSERQPRIQYNFAKLMCKRLVSKLIGSKVFPAIRVEDDPVTTEYIKFVIKASGIKSKLLEPIRRELASGSVLVRFYFAMGAIRLEYYLSKYCYPEFDAAGNLSFVRVQYVYDDKKDLDENGKPKQKWYRLDLGTQADILYNNPEFKEDEEPQFSVVSEAPHELGFVQAEWFRTAEERDSPDGYSLIADILPFVDELNYSLSQSSQATAYNQDPQLVFKGMDEDELDGLIRSSMKAWNLGRKDADAKFLESNLSGVKTAIELRDKLRINLQDISRIIMHDPEKMVASAQSGKAMEVLHEPMIELITELRPGLEVPLKNLIVKMAVTNLVLIDRGLPPAVTVPPGFTPQSLEVLLTWPPVFPMTMQDLQQKVSTISAATGASLISRETGTRWLAPDFDVEDVDAEIQKIASQPVINPFGMF